MSNSYCGYKWIFSNDLEVTHICILKFEHDGDHYCGIWHNDYKCASSQKIKKRRK